MKKKDLTDLRNKDQKELKEVLSKKRLEITAFMAKSTAGEKNLKKRKNLRREIAQILTIIKEKELIEKMKEENPTSPKLRGAKEEKTK